MFPGRPQGRCLLVFSSGLGGLETDLIHAGTEVEKDLRRAS
jgi:hypothetical protein